MRKPETSRQPMRDLLEGLGLSSDPKELIAASASGVAITAFRVLAQALGLSEEALGKLIGLSGAALSGERITVRLSSPESERVIRIALLLNFSTRVFEDVDAGARWMKEPNISLGGALPLDYARTEVGALEVRYLLGRVEYGVYS